ncbi:MAG: LicD family protein [Eubacterium sp.]|nr:LicD family protein [Eubacterium sp.]
MEFEQDYFESEVRAGFYVPGIMKRCWAAQLEILSDINKVCEKHNLKWSLAYGSMMGAARHKGFIPWDDDMDIYMRRDDFEVFRSVFREEMPAGNEMFGPETPGYDNWIWRVVNVAGVGSSDDFLAKYHGFPYSAGIDIFVLEFLSPNEEENKDRDAAAVCNLVLLHFLMDAWSRTKAPKGRKPQAITLNELAKVKKKNTWRKELETMLEKHERFCHVKFDRNESILDQAFRLHEKLCKRFNGEGAKQAAVLGWWLTNKNDLYPVDYLEHTKQIDFENTKAYIPETYDADLRKIFGDWTVPQRFSGHGYPYFLSTENLVLERAKGKMANPYFYEFDSKDLEVTKNSKDDTYKVAIREMLKIMAELLHGLEKCHFKDTELVVNLLSDLQKVTIDLGECIEDRYTIAAKIVKKLEDYCEAIYVLYQMVTEAEDPSAMEEECESSLGELCDSFLAIRLKIGKNILDKKEVIFAPLQYKHWENLSGLFHKLKENPKYDVYIMPLPYYRKDGMMEKISETTNEKDLFAKEEVMILDAATTDLASRHPDYLVIDSAADQYDSTLNVEPEFYSRKLAEITDHLIYVPWIKVDEFTTGETLMMRSAKFYLSVPGVIKAENSFVQSEKMADTYRKVLTEFAGDDTAEIWDKKIQPYEKISEVF